MDSSAINPADLDAVARTMVAEGGKDPTSQLAVGSVIANRLAAGGYGDTPSAVVLAPKQFTTWSNGQAQRVDPNSSAYGTARLIAADILSGTAPDPTGGATNFFAPSGMPGGRPPAWAGGGVAIGGNVFNAPRGAVVRKIQQLSGRPQDGGPDVDGLLAAWGVGSQGGSAQSAQASPASPAGGQDSGPDVDALLSAWGASPAAPPPPPAKSTDAPAYPTTLTIRPKATGNAAFGSLDAARAAMQPQAQPGPDNNATAAAVTGAIGGIPVVGPYALAGMERLSALQRSQDNGTNYADELARVQAADAARGQDHPTATLAGEIGGTALGYGALGATSAGARALGITGDNLLSRAVAGGLTNAAIGGADAAVRSGGDPVESGVSGLVGLGAGAAGPVAGRAVEMAGSRLAPYLAGFQPQAAARNALLDAIQGTGGNLDDLAARMQANPRLSLMDVNPGARNLAQGLAAQSGDARDTLVRAYTQRAAGAQDAVTGALDDAMGPTPDVLATLSGIRQRAADNARQGFGAALRNAGPVDLSAAIQSLDDQIRPGVGQVTSVDSGIPLSPVQQRLQQIRGMLTDGSSVLTDPMRLHQLQSNLRTEAETLLGSSTGSDRLLGRAVMGARNNIVSAIDDATGGTFRPAQQQYASDQAIEDAFNRGLSIFSNRSGVNGLEDRPEYWRAFVNGASPGELDALRLGARTAADQQMGSVRNAARKGAAIPEVGFNQQKLAAVLGDQEAGTLASRMADEQDIARTNAALFDGSQTQPRQQAKLATAVREIGPLSMEVGLPTFAAATGSPWTGAALGGVALARRGLQYAGQRADLARNALQAQMLSGSGMAGQAVMNRLMMAANAAPSSLPMLARGGGNALALALDSAPLARNRLFEATQGR